jgi:hypothetical protein
MANIRRVTDLAHLAVTDNVNTRRDLLHNGIINRAAHGLIKNFCVIWLALILSKQHVHHVLWPGEAADVCG